MTSVNDRDETRRYGRAAGLLSAGIALGGLLIYAYFGLASHSLTADEYGEIVVLWSSIVVVVSILFRPIEQLLARTVAEAHARDASDGHALRVAATIAIGLACAFLIVAFAARGLIQDELFAGDSTVFFVFVSGVLVYGLDFFTRGVVAGRGEFRLYATLLIAYGVVFIAFAAIVALDLGPGFHFLAVGISASPLVGLAIVLFSIVVSGSRRSEPAPTADSYGPGSIRATLAHGSGFAAAVLVVMLSEQVLVNAGPLIVRGSEGAASAGFVFNIVMVARAPIALFQGVAASLLPHLTRLRAGGAEAGQRAFSEAVRTTTLGVWTVAGAIALAMLIAGPQLMQAAFGSSFDYDRADLLIICVGLALFLTAATLNQAALARGQERLVAVAWAVAAVGFLGVNMLPVGDAALRVELGLACASAGLCAVLVSLYRRKDPGPGAGLQPGSPHELQATLAAAEDVS